MTDPASTAQAGEETFADVFREWQRELRETTVAAPVMCYGRPMFSGDDQHADGLPFHIDMDMGGRTETKEKPTT